MNIVEDDHDRIGRQLAHQGHQARQREGHDSDSAGAQPAQEIVIERTDVGQRVRQVVNEDHRILVALAERQPRRCGADHRSELRQQHGLAVARRSADDDHRRIRVGLQPSQQALAPHTVVGASRRAQPSTSGGSDGRTRVSSLT